MHKALGSADRQEREKERKKERECVLVRQKSSLIHYLERMRKYVYCLYGIKIC
jgi:hypothetical protein